MKKIYPLRLWFGILLLFFSLLLLSSSVWPLERVQHVIPSTLANSLAASPETEAPGSTETRLLTIEWPRRVRVGDSDMVQLSFSVDPDGQLRDPNSGQIIEIPNLYDTHNLVLEVRLDIAGLQVAPQATISEPLRAGQSLIFYWSISPIQAGTYRGNLWVYLNIVPKGGGEIDRRALVAYRMEIEGRSVLGLPASTARWGGAAGTALGLVFSLPFLEEMLRRSWNRIRKKLGKQGR
jgi:hypothetical protein